MTTILDTLKKGTEYLVRHHVEEARLNMELLLGHVLEMDRMQLYIDFDRPIEEDALNILRDLTVRRGKGEPLQYLQGSVEFCSLNFSIDSRALIPRPETEELVHRLIQREWPQELAILDIGCGSGAIGISLTHHLSEKQPQTTLVDLSQDALSLAQENASKLLPSTPVRILQSDLFSSLKGESYHLIVANLPYVPLTDKDSLSREVLREPAMALYGGETGIEIMDRFLAEAPSHLHDGGVIAMEYGFGQAEALERLAREHDLGEIEIHSDLSGVERLLFAVKIATDC